MDPDSDSLETFAKHSYEYPFLLIQELCHVGQVKTSIFSLIKMVYLIPDLLLSQRGVFLPLLLWIIPLGPSFPTRVFIRLV